MRNVTKMFTRSLLFVAVSIMLFAKVGWSEVYVQIGTGTTLTVAVPFYALYEDSRSQLIYLASEMSPTLIPGAISKVGFNFQGATGFPLDNFNIRMKHTAKSAWTLADGFDEGGWTTVFSSAQLTHPGTGWQTFTLQTPFVWDGTSNLEIEFCHDGIDWGSSWYVYATATGATGSTNWLSHYKYIDGSTGCTLPAPGYVSLSRANIRLYQNNESLSGTVTSAATGLPLAGATVAGAAATSTTNATGAYTMIVPAGTNNYTASFPPNYLSQTKSATVPTGGSATLNFSLSPVPCYLTGIVTNAANGNPIKGAKVNVNGNVSYSTDGGVFTVEVFPGGSFPVSFTKVGFKDSTTISYTFIPAAITTVNIAMKEKIFGPSEPFIATLTGTPATQVALNWGIPTVDYELIYDDGLAETSTVWGTAGNMNAVAFTPLNYPATILGGSVNIGNATDYPDGTLIADIDAFQIQIFDGTGPGGTPGAAVGDPIDVQPTTFGWNTFTLPATVCPTGKFFLVMIQGGAPPTAARLAVDNEDPQLRSYNRNVTSGGPWLPAEGNFMMRAVVNGVGAAMDASDALVGYQVYRLKQFEESTPALWTSVSTPTGASTVDNSWPSLPDQAYKWAVKAQYSGNRWSGFIFSNVLGKNWATTVQVNVLLTCAATAQAGTLVTLENINLPDTAYSATTGADGIVNFTNVWKGQYHMAVSHTFYDIDLQDVTILGPSIFDVTLMKVKDPITNLVVDGKSLESSWSPPRSFVPEFLEDWSSGSFATNGWTTDCDNWGISSFGNPAPSVEFNWSPNIFGYDQYLTSKVISVTEANIHILSYDIYLSNFSSSALNTMAVEIWNGTTWTVLETLENSGDIAWTNKSFDITSYMVNNTFKFRFHAAGEDSYEINNWNIDNISITGMDAVSGPNACVLGYNFYLNDVLSGFTMDTTYNIPTSQVAYGTDYNACVKAVYANGYSIGVCEPFTSRFLCPPTELAGTPFESTAYLTWTKPNCGGGAGCTDNSYIFDDGTGETGWRINPLAEAWLGNYFPIDAALTGVIKSVDVSFMVYGGSVDAPFTIDIFNGAGVLVGSSAPFTATAGSWINVPLNNIPYSGPFYGMVKWNSITQSSHYLNEDTGGPQASLDLAYYYDVTDGWALLSSFGYAGGNFLLRANVCENNKKGPATAAQTVPARTGSNASFTGTQVSYPSYTPAASNAPTSVPPALLGYKIYRDGVDIAFVEDPDMLEYFDYNLEPATYSYEVKARYDVSPVAPLADNSLAAGPVDVTINYGRPIPFYEPWDNGTFSFNEWNSTGGWEIVPGFGNPAPSADFSGLTLNVLNYSSSFVSPVLSAAAYNCAKVWLDFDLKLINRNATGAEVLTVEVYKNGTWSKLTDFANTASFEWTPQHIEIKAVVGKAFKVRFTASGVNSQDILHWYVDNIGVYAVCQPAMNLTGEALAMDVHLDWSPPVCATAPVGNILDEGFESGIFPPQFFTQVITNTAYTWEQIDASSSLGVHSGDGAAQVWWDYDHQDEWLIAQDIIVTGPLTFWANAYLGSTYLDHYYVKVSTDNGATWTEMLDFSTLSGGRLEWVEPFTVDLSAYDGQAIDIAWQFVDGDGAGLWYAAAIDDLYVGTKKIPTSSLKRESHANAAAAKSSGINEEERLRISRMGVLPSISFDKLYPSRSINEVQGYDVYRKGPIETDFAKINTSLVTDTSYVDPSLNAGGYKYFVLSVFAECTDVMPSDTVLIDVVTGIDPVSKVGGISIFPNPATEVVNVKSDYSITSIDVMNFVGQTVYTNSDVAMKSAKINVSTFTPGVYFVKVSTSEGVRTVKITVTH